MSRVSQKFWGHTMNGNKKAGFEKAFCFKEMKGYEKSFSENFHLDFPKHF